MQPELKLIREIAGPEGWHRWMLTLWINPNDQGTTHLIHVERPLGTSDLKWRTILNETGATFSDLPPQDPEGPTINSGSIVQNVTIGNSLRPIAFDIWTQVSKYKTIGSTLTLSATVDATTLTHTAIVTCPDKFCRGPYDPPTRTDHLEAFFNCVDNSCDMECLMDSIHKGFNIAVLVRALSEIFALPA